MTLRDVLLFALIVAGVIIGSTQQAHAARTVIINPDGSGSIGRTTFPSGYFPPNQVNSGTRVPVRGTAPVTISGATGQVIATADHYVRHNDAAGRAINTPVRQRITIPPGTIAAAGRIAARALPYASFVAIAAQAVNELATDGITPTDYLNGLQGWQRAIEGGVPPETNGEVVSVFVSSGVAAAVTPPSIGAPVIPSPSGAVSLLDAVAPEGQTCATNRHWWATSSGTSTENANQHYARRDCCALNSSPGACAGGQGYIRIEVAGVYQCADGTIPDVEDLCPSDSYAEATDTDLESAFFSASPVSQALIANELVDGAQDLPLPSNTPSETDFPLPGGGTGSSTSVESPPVTSTTTTYDELGNPQTLETVSREVVTTTTAGNSISNTTITTNVVTTTTTTNLTTNTVVNETVTEVAQPGPGNDIGTDPSTGLPIPDDQQPEPEPTANFTDEEFGEVPDLYEQKYPDGLIGVWNEKRDDLMSTALIDGAVSMFDGAPGGGSCPTWEMPLNFGSMGDFGTADLSPPCWIWDVIALILLATATFTAWRMIF